MKTPITCLLLTAALWSGAVYAAEKAPAPPPEAEVKNDLNSIVADCEKKKLPADQEIDCIEQGYLKFMGVEPQGDS